MRIRFSEIARDELIDAIEWYQRQQPGLGLRFKTEVRQAALRIAKSPMLFPVELADVRRYAMNRFPYSLRYVVRDREVWIIAISHQHRHPDYWVTRLDSRLL